MKETKTAYRWVVAALIVVIIVMGLMWSQDSKPAESSLQAFQREVEEKCNSFSVGSGTQSSTCTNFLEGFSDTLERYQGQIEDNIEAEETPTATTTASSSMPMGTSATTSVSTTTTVPSGQ